MKLLSEIISKRVLNLFSGKIEGTVKNICLDDNYKKIKDLVIFDDEDEEYLVNCDKIYSIGKDAIVIKNSEAIQLLSTALIFNDNNPINKPVFSILGEELGNINDIEFTDKLKINKYLTKTHSFLSNQILNINNEVIIHNKDTQIKLNQFKPKIFIPPIPTKQEKVFLLTPQIESPQNENPIKITSSPSPQRVIGNTGILLGRKVIKNIYGVNNELLIKKDNLINANNLAKAKQHGKLTEITLFSKSK